MEITAFPQLITSSLCSRKIRERWRWRLIDLTTCALIHLAEFEPFYFQDYVLGF